MVIANPRAGRAGGRRLARALTDLRAGGVCVDVARPQGPADARARAAGAAASGYDVVVAAGGDGTVAEVAAGLLDGAGSPDGRRPALGVLPLGTANVLAHELGLPRRPEAAARVLRAGHRRVLWPGIVNGRPFMMMASVGIDSHIVHHMDAGLKRRTGKLAYVWALLGAAFRYRYPPVAVTVEAPDGHTETLRGPLVLITRGRCYGGPLVVAPEADIGTPLLWAVVLTRGGAWATARYGLALLAGRLPRQPGVRLCPARRVRLAAAEPGADSAGAALPLQADGDAIGTLPAEIGVGPVALEVLAPA
nr:diacylglycerol kinase family protein [Roseospira goensis]